MENNFNGWVYGEEKPKINIDIGYYFKEFSEPDLDRDGIVCRSKWFKFRIHEMPKFEPLADGKEVLQANVIDFTLTSKAAWDYFPNTYLNDWLIHEKRKWTKIMKEYLLNRVRRLIYDDFWTQMVEKDMKDEYDIEFNLVEIDPPNELS